MTNAINQRQIELARAVCLNGVEQDRVPQPPAVHAGLRTRVGNGRWGGENQ